MKMKNSMKAALFAVAMGFMFIPFAVSQASCEPNSIDINSASKEELELLDGIGETLAERITEQRPFESLDVLVSVEQIGEGTVTNIKEQGCGYVAVEEQQEEEEQEQSVEEKEVPIINIELRIDGPEISIEETIEIEDNCEISVVNSETEEESARMFSDAFLGICAVAAAQEEGFVEAFEVIEFAFGLWLDSINGAATTEDFSAFWALSHNGDSAKVGIADLSLEDGDTVSLVYPTIQEEDDSAETVTIDLSIEGPGISVDQKDFLVEKKCEVIDTDAVSHVFEEDFLAVCALQAVLESGLVDEIGFSNEFPEFGLFVESIDGIPTESTAGGFWALTHNGEDAQSGITNLILEPEDILSVVYTEFNNEKEQEEENNSGGGSGGGGNQEQDVAGQQTFNVESAIEFLVSAQNANGSIENSLFTDWAAIAFGAYNPNHPKAENIRSYLLSDPNSGTFATDYERRAMALMALGLNPYNATSTNYIQAIVEEFQDGQIGDETLVNDDIFGLLVLRKAGYVSSDEIIQDTTAFILGFQNEDGSWPGGVDMTAAAIQALSFVPDIEGVSDSMAEAKVYLQSKQEDNGGFGNSDATSWTMQAIAALGEDGSWTSANGNTPGDFLYNLQKEDGSIDVQANSAWSTSYAIPAALGKSWGEVLVAFERSDPSSSGGLPSSSFSNASEEQDEQQGAFQFEETTEFTSTSVIIVRENGKTKEVQATVVIPEDNTAIVKGDEEWDGTIDVQILKEDQEDISQFSVSGAIQVILGGRLSLSFDDPIIVTIPVTAKNGTVLQVFTRSELEEDFTYLSDCVVEDSSCAIETMHLSTFVAAENQAASENIQIEQTNATTIDRQEAWKQLAEIGQQANELRKQVDAFAGKESTTSTVTPLPPQQEVEEPSVQPIQDEQEDVPGNAQEEIEDTPEEEQTGSLAENSLAQASEAADGWDTQLIIAIFVGIGILGAGIYGLRGMQKKTE